MAADECDWQTVVMVRGHADTCVVTLAYNAASGSLDTYDARGTWDQIIWRLCDDDGTPVDTSLD